MKQPCPHDPQELKGLPIGMYHCPECGEMVIAGLPHDPPDDGLTEEIKLEISPNRA